MSKDEFGERIGEPSNEVSTPNMELLVESSVSGDQLPLSFDWRKAGIVTDVLVQKNCSSEWASSAVSRTFNIAAMIWKITKMLLL